MEGVRDAVRRTDDGERIGGEDEVQLTLGGVAQQVRRGEPSDARPRQ